MKIKLSKHSVINLHFVTDFIDAIKSLGTEKDYPEKGSYNGSSHVASVSKGVVTVKKSKTSDTSENYKKSMNAQLNIDQYTSGNKNPSNDDLKDNVAYDDKTINIAVDNELNVNSSRSQDIKREENFLGEDSGTEENVDSANADSGYVKVDTLDVSKWSDVKTRAQNSGVTLEISDVSDNNEDNGIKKDAESEDKDKDNEEDNKDSYV